MVQIIPPRQGLASVLPKVLEPVRRQLGVANGVLDVLVAQVGLQRARVAAIIGELEPTGVAQHVRVHLQRSEPGHLSGTREHLIPAEVCAVASRQPSHARAARPPPWLSPRPPILPWLGESWPAALACRPPSPASRRRAGRPRTPCPPRRPPPPPPGASRQPRLATRPPACTCARSSSPCAWTHSP